MRLGNISNVLSMTLAKSSVGYYMSGGFSGSLFTKYCQPVVGNQGRGAMCPSVRWLLTSKLNALMDIIHFSKF